MKLYKYQKFLESTEDIHSICKKYGIEDYTVNEDGSIDVEGDVDLRDKRLTKLPLKFNHVSGGFYCYNNQLVTLEGSPQSVGSHFYCGNNQLTTLEGGPKSVGGGFYCQLAFYKDLDMESSEYRPISEIKEELTAFENSIIQYLHQNEFDDEYEFMGMSIKIDGDPQAHNLQRVSLNFVNKSAEKTPYSNIY